jgi:hypothetical protein
MTIRSYNTNTPPKVTRDNVLGGNGADLQTIEDRLENVRDFLVPWGTKLTTVTAEAQQYLPVQAAGNKELFFQAVTWLKYCVQHYLNNTSTWYLNVARGNVQGALASAVPLAKRDSLDVRDTTALPRHTTFVIQPSFEQPYTVGQQRKQLTDHGRATSLLHELTHSLFGTKDVYGVPGDIDRPYTFLEDGLQPGPNWQEIYLPERCRALAESRKTFRAGTMPQPMPYAWMNAENWTRALMKGLYPGDNREPAEFNLL